MTCPFSVCVLDISLSLDADFRSAWFDVRFVRRFHVFVYCRWVPLMGETSPVVNLTSHFHPNVLMLCLTCLGHGNAVTLYTSPLTVGAMPVIHLHDRNPKKRNVGNSCTRRDGTPGWATQQQWIIWRPLPVAGPHIHKSTCIHKVYIYTYGYDYGTFNNSLWSHLRCGITSSSLWVYTDDKLPNHKTPFHFQSMPTNILIIHWENV